MSNEIKNNGTHATQADQVNTQPDSSRRRFVQAAAVGTLVITPLALTGCGGDTEGDGRDAPKKTKSKGGSGTNTPKPSDGSKPAAGKYETVPADQLSAKHTVTVKVGYEGPHVAADDASRKRTDLGAGDGELASGVKDGGYPNGPNQFGVTHVINENVLTVDMGGAVGLAQALVVLKPKNVAKVAVNTNKEVTIDNSFFRFEPRFAAVAKGALVTWKNGDPVNHNVQASGLAPAGTGPSIPNGGTMAKDQSLTTDKPGFIRTGLYGVSCSLHAWELSRIMVLDHAYAAYTTFKSAEVKIDNVAEGEYTLEVWHESATKPVISKDIAVRGAVTEEVKVPKLT